MRGVQTCVCFAAPAEMLGEVVGVAVVAVPGVPPPTLPELQAALRVDFSPRWRPQLPTLTLTLTPTLTPNSNPTPDPNPYPDPHPHPHPDPNPNPNPNQVAAAATGAHGRYS